MRGGVPLKSDLCSSQLILSICENDYSFSNEEKSSFQPGWLNETTREEEYSSSILKAFEYETSDELDTYVYIGEFERYSGGGYVYQFRGSLSDLQSNISELHQLGWIDEKTRAIFIELTLYNPNVQLFTSIIFLLEFLSTGGVFPTARFEPINFYSNSIFSILNRKKFLRFYLVFSSVLQLICTILYMGFIIYFIIIEIRSLFKLKLNYFRQFWSWIELVIIGCSWGSIGAYICRFQESNRISQLLEQTNGYVYINLQFLVYINDILTYLLAFCCFFATIKFVHLFRFNQRLSLFTETLQSAGKERLSFSMMFSIIFMSFVSLFYLLFISKMESCSTLLETVQMLFQMTVMKYSTSEFIQADAFLGPFCFAIFIFLVVFVCLSMFLSIIIATFRRVRKNRIEEQGIITFIFKKFLRWTGKNVYS